ncbi:MAG TPA: type II toxin-antitoxin system VapC family toxin [Chloroflexia bacterium]|jgi:PIN domain nuclease of toxin-antitoxin system|nr:type II toxin-antitoxin system VapC family toxin [Chloroflexia bacterium]
MKLLLDTHSFLWFVQGDPNLGVNASAQIGDESNEIYLSMASVWEIAIKISVGKLKIDQELDSFLYDQLNLNRMSIINISIEHVSKVANMPFHHRDPFDRLIIAQSINEQMPIVSRDEAFDAYGVTRIW